MPNLLPILQLKTKEKIKMHNKLNPKLKFKTLISSLLILVMLMAIHPFAYAQETEAEATQASNSATLENIKQIIKDNLTSGAVRGAIDNLLNRKTAIYGEVTRVTGETISIAHRLGTRIIPVNEAFLISKDDKEITISDIAVENWVTILGRIKDDNFSPVFIYVYNESLLPKSQYVELGTITNITNKSINILPRSNQTEQTITILNSTQFEDVDGDEISLSDLSEDITVLVSGHSSNTAVEALTIRSLAPISDNEE
jgi:hypothetical protein